MADQEQDDSEREHEPSERKLARAREEGDVVRSEDMQTAAAFSGLVLALLIFGGWSMAAAGNAGMVFLDQPDRLADLSGDGAAKRIGALALQMAAPVALLLVGPALAVVVLLVATRSLVFAPSKLAFKASRLSILANAGHKFGRAGLVDFAKRFAKMIAVSLLLAMYLNGLSEEVMASSRLETGQVVMMIVGDTMGFLKLFLALAVVFGLVDLLWQRAEFMRRNRMNRKELLDEMKESEGDPHVKADRRRRAQEIATNRMLADVPKADVVIVNPTHYAVALAWNRTSGNVPRCVAKGTDEIAARIRERAMEAGVPIRPDPPTARALYAAVDIGREIRPEHYAAVAAAIRFSDAMRKKARRR